MDFTSCSQNTSKGEESFYEETPGSFEPSQIYPRFAHRPLGRTKASQCGPWGLGSGAAGQIPVRSSPERFEEGSHATDLWLELGSRRRRQGGPAARRFPGPCGWVHRRGGGLGEQGVALEAVLDLG
jgi:hypothetical protein